MNRPVAKTTTHFFDLTLKKMLSHFRFKHKDNANGTGGSSGSLVLLLFMRFSRDCTEISLFESSDDYGSRLGVLGHSACGPALTFSDIVPGKGLRQPLRLSHSFFMDGACLVFLLPAFTYLGHDCQGLLSPCDGSACVHKLYLGLYSHSKELISFKLAMKLDTTAFYNLILVLMTLTCPEGHREMRKLKHM